MQHMDSFKEKVKRKNRISHKRYMSTPLLIKKMGNVMKETKPKKIPSIKKKLEKSTNSGSYSNQIPIIDDDDSSDYIEHKELNPMEKYVGKNTQ